MRGSRIKGAFIIPLGKKNHVLYVGVGFDKLENKKPLVRCTLPLPASFAYEFHATPLFPLFIGLCGQVLKTVDGLNQPRVKALFELHRSGRPIEDLDRFAVLADHDLPARDLISLVLERDKREPRAGLFRTPATGSSSRARR